MSHQIIWWLYRWHCLNSILCFNSCGTYLLYLDQTIYRFNLKLQVSFKELLQVTVKLYSISGKQNKCLKAGKLGLPWWRSGWESACQCRAHDGSSPGLGRSHMPWSSWAREPQLLSLRVWRLCSATREAAIVRGPRTAMKSGPRLPQLEKALAQKRRPNTAKNK